MKSVFVIAGSLLLSLGAAAQQVPAGYQAPVSPPFAPVTLDKEQFDQFTAYINTRLPTGEGRPLIEALERLEMQAAMRAQSDAAATKAKADAEAKAKADAEAAKKPPADATKP